jgi:hypothetical protein
MTEKQTATAPAPRAHIVAIRRNGVVEGHQLRVNGGGPGHSKFFAASKHGGPEKAHRAALSMVREMGLPKPVRRGGSPVGRVFKTSHTQAAGIRFMWVEGQLGTVLRVVASWTDKRKRPRQTSFSVERNGLEGALDKAIAARTSAGAPTPDRAVLLRRLQKAYRAGYAG